MQTTLMEQLALMPENQTIADNFSIAWSKINSPLYSKILVSVSGGGDSDVLIDIISRCDKEGKAVYAWYDTGLEYMATKEHLAFLENRYGIKIGTYKPKKTIPQSCREYGIPFLSKRVSEYIYRLQKHGFDFANGDRPFEELYKEYPRCKSALMWWCDMNKSGALCIKDYKYLKEFMMQNPPDFRIASKCCDHAKKNVAHKILKETRCQLNCTGVRKAEGGQRVIAYKSCFSQREDDADLYMPLFWYKDDDKKQYVDEMGVVHSRCYTEYGLRRTGCAGCPFGKKSYEELEVIKTYEPKLYKACLNIFGKSYEYTRQFREYQKMRKEEDRKKTVLPRVPAIE